MSRSPINAEKDASSIPLDDPIEFVCGVCGSERVRRVRHGGIASLAGGVHWYEVLCEDCGCYTEYEREWG